MQAQLPGILEIRKSPQLILTGKELTYFLKTSKVCSQPIVAERCGPQPGNVCAVYSLSVQLGEVRAAGFVGFA
jgi:hypothetical protein